MLDLAWVDMIFSKLALSYGTRFRIVGSRNLVRAQWAHDLHGLGVAEIRHALSNLPRDYPPDAGSFRTLALSLPKAPPEPPPLYPPSPAQLAEVNHAIAGFKARDKHGPADPLKWARRLRQREESGEDLSRLQRLFWREALARELLADRIAAEEQQGSP